jgi:hypothetical protein
LHHAGAHRAGVLRGLKAMDNLPGKLFLVWLLATPLACALGWWLTRRYRRALVALMRAPRTTPSPAAVDAAPNNPTPSAGQRPALPTRAQWRRAEQRLITLLAAVSALMALTHGALTHWQLVNSGWSWPRMLLLSLLFVWPLLPAVGALRRWSRARLLAALALWLGCAWSVAMWRSYETQSPLTVATWLAATVLPPALAFVLLTSRNTRAAAPWLWPPLALLVLAGVLGLDMLAWLIRTESPLVGWLAQWIGPVWAFTAFIAAAIALAWWPVQRFARALARAYARRWVSDLVVLYFTAWALALSFDALANGVMSLLPLSWIALALVVASRRQAAPLTRPPTLLVLRVFQQDANVAALFDDVIERWRAVGNTVLIAGTDAVADTLDAADLFDFLDGRLASRFVHHASEVPQRLAAFDWTPDAEGRYRVNECYCHDSSWQAALDALVQRADAVLMDLRGFRAKNAGCRFELGVLASAPQLQRVVVLTDPSTELAVAKADAAAGPPGRFEWIELPAGARRRDAARRVIAALAGAPSRAATSASPHERQHHAHTTPR